VVKLHSNGKLYGGEIGLLYKRKVNAFIANSLIRSIILYRHRCNRRAEVEATVTKLRLVHRAPNRGWTRASGGGIAPR
jgi:hypothetical protein